MINLDRNQPDRHVAVLAGPLDNRTADGFDEWLRKYTDHFGTKGALYLDLKDLECLSSRAISSIVYYYDKFNSDGGIFRLQNVPPAASVSLDKLGFGNLDLIVKE